jgi:hypothetical protein
VQCSAVQCSAVQCSALQCSAVGTNKMLKYFDFAQQPLRVDDILDCVLNLWTLPVRERPQ